MKLFRRRTTTPATATIDVAAAPPLSPLAPLDLNDHSEIAAVLDVAGHIGEILICAGSTNSDAAEHVKAITESFGLWDCHVDLTHSRIRLFARVDNNPRDPVNVIRVIPAQAQDFKKLRQVDSLIRDIHTGHASLADAQRRLHAISNAEASISLTGVITAWACMGGAVSVLLGGDLAVSLLSMLAAAAIIALGALLGRLRLPVFFQNVAGGIFAAVLAALAYHIGTDYGLILRPSMVIGTSIVAMLAGLTLVQAIQNGVTFAPVTGNARFFDTIIITCGIVAGVGIGIELSNALNMPLPPMETVAVPNFASNSIRVLGGALASAAFARACYAEWPSVAVSGLTALAGSSLYYFALQPTVLDGISAIAVTAVFIGLLGGLLARRFHIPPLIVTIAGVTPLLPGLAIYRGMYGVLHDQVLVGFANLTLALATATALSAGVVFGEWIARKIRRPRGLASYKQLARIMGSSSGFFN
ncbi:MAG: threonine/serine exporter family protein [Corynebacterium sp.]|uniref:threonine/serine exporter ThrE n=1 Tax=Corynebacterium sp. TaxID=1720 RepID=UPI0026DB7293|nr:threonine/serine exporter family protein [Corynebacterium sp.]MDO5099425.1 threonine/serine exporter family protein [Corynebacterium sp.]